MKKDFIDGTNVLASGYVFNVLLGLTLFLLNFEALMKIKIFKLSYIF